MRGAERLVGGLVGVCVSVCVMAACGNNSAMPDAAMPDAAMPDAMTFSPRVYRWVLDNEILPVSNAQAREFGLDLDGDLIGARVRLQMVTPKGSHRV